MISANEVRWFMKISFVYYLFLFYTGNYKQRKIEKFQPFYEAAVAWTRFPKFIKFFYMPCSVNLISSAIYSKLSLGKLVFV